MNMEWLNSFAAAAKLKVFPKPQKPLIFLNQH